MLAYLNGEFIPASQLAIASEDLGFVQGVSISERLRTFRGQVFRLDDHLERLANSLHIVDLHPGLSIERIGELVEELVSRNRRLLTAGDDLGSVVVHHARNTGPATAHRGDQDISAAVRPVEFVLRTWSITHRDRSSAGSRILLASRL